MRIKLLTVLVLTAALAFVASDCEKSGSGELVIQAYDAPFRGNVEHIYLDIDEVAVHKSSEGEDEAGWITVSEEDTMMDFLTLVNGTMAGLIDAELDEGRYSEIRLILGEDSYIVVDSQSYELKVPSGTSSGVKLKINFRIDPNEVTELYLDFDAERSINKHPSQDKYSLKPTFRVMKKTDSGAISGWVKKADATPIPNASVYAVSGTDSVTTITSPDGHYKLIVPAGTYNLSAAAEGYTCTTTYQGIEVQADEHVTGKNFTMQ